MRCLTRSAVLAAGFGFAFAALPVRAAAPSPALTSFGASQAVSAYELPTDFNVQPFGASPLLQTLYGSAAPGFAASTLLSTTLALDTGRNLDIAARFDDYDGGPSPLLSAATAPYLGLANGGRYAGFTFAPTADFRLRLGTAFNSDRLDHFGLQSDNDLPFISDPSRTQSLLAGLSWDFAQSSGIGFTAISSSRAGMPFAFEAGGNLAIPGKTSTDALGVSAHLGLGSGWVTKLAYSEGLSQLDLRSGQSSSEEHSYSIAVAKRGLFGDDAVGFSFSRPAPGLVGSFAGLTSSGDLPPMIVTRGENLVTPSAETDFQLGYVTNFLNGALALQANASYQVNYQGQTGATSVSLLSRAKIKF